MNTPHILGVRVDDISLQDALQNIEMELSSSASQNFVVTPNPEICLLAEKNEEYA